MPIPGEFFPNDFNQGVSLSGPTWNVGTNKLHQWRFIHFIKPFMNSPEGFKFLINVRYIDKEYKKGAHHVCPDAITLFQEWYGIKHISGRLTQLSEYACRLRLIVSQTQVDFKAEEYIDSAYTTYIHDRVLRQLYKKPKHRKSRK